MLEYTLEQKKKRRTTKRQSINYEIKQQDTK